MFFFFFFLYAEKGFFFFLPVGNQCNTTCVPSETLYTEGNRCQTAATHCSYDTNLITACPVQICLTGVWQCCFFCVFFLLRLNVNACWFSYVRCAVCYVMYWCAVSHLLSITDVTRFSLEIAIFFQCCRS